VVDPKTPYVLDGWTSNMPTGAGEDIAAWFPISS